MNRHRANFLLLVTLSALLLEASTASALYIPNKLFGAMYTDYGDIFPTTINHPFFENVTPIPSSYIIEETGITGCCAQNGQEGGKFERNEHVARFSTNGEVGGATGHQFQRREDWDIAFDMKIETPNVAPRKEAGIYFKSPIGNSIFIATSNDTHYGTGPGEITSIFTDVLPAFAFGSSSGPLGDYNANGTVDAADYIIWRDTLGSTTDFRANGTNEGGSLDLIDQADYDVWRSHFGESNTGGTRYNVGDTLRMRLIYTPPVLANNALPDVANDPNVVTPGTIEYRISLNGGSVISSGALPFTNIWQGIPNGTQIMLRVQNMGTAAVVNDSSKVTFSNFDFNGDAPGSGAGLDVSGVPEPGSVLLFVIGCVLAASTQRRRG